MQHPTSSQNTSSLSTTAPAYKVSVYALFALLLRLGSATSVVHCNMSSIPSSGTQPGVMAPSHSVNTSGTTSAASTYHMRPLQRDDLLAVAQIHYRSFNDPTNTTPDILGNLIGSEPDPDTGEPITQEDYISRTHKRELDNFDSGVYTFIGAFARSRTGENKEELAGFSVWKFVEPSQSSDLAALQAKLTPESRETLLSRFFLQMYKTRESYMAEKTYYWLKLLCIDPAHQRRGVGSLLLTWGLQKASEQNIDAFLESSPMGIGTYHKAGFQIVAWDSVPEPRSPTGKVEWPYMIHRAAPLPNA